MFFQGGLDNLTLEDPEKGDRYENGDPTLKNWQYISNREEPAEGEGKAGLPRGGGHSRVDHLWQGSAIASQATSTSSEPPSGSYVAISYISNDWHYQDMEKNNIENEAQSLATLLSDKAKDIKLNMLTPMLLTRTQTTRLFITRFRHKNVSLGMFRFFQNILLVFLLLIVCKPIPVLVLFRTSEFTQSRLFDYVA